MPCQLWMKDGKLIIDENGSPILSEDCPCYDDCCEQLVEWMVREMTKTYTACVPCAYGDTELGICGECQIEDPNAPTGYWDGKYVKRSVNPILIYGQMDTDCDNGIYITSQPADGNAYKDGEIITITACDQEFEVPYLDPNALPDPTQCRDPDVGCMQFLKVFCKQGDQILYPIIAAPDLPGPPAFSNTINLCTQTYWQHCFDPNPVRYASCAVQIIAPRYMFDDVVTTGEPDMTKVWGVAACWCEGNGKWEFKKYCGGSSGNGLLVVNTPFTAEMEDKVDEQGNPILDENDEPIQVLKCEITCQGQKDLVEEMTKHYAESIQHADVYFFRATEDPNEWEEWTGETPEYTSCFWGYLPLSALYGYVCDHEDENGVLRSYDHFVIFDCDCNMTEQEEPHTGSLDPNSMGFYVSEQDLCTVACPDLWAMRAYAEATGMEMSPITDWTDGQGFDPADPDWTMWGPYLSGDGGVILQEDYRAPGQNIYSIGGSACVFAAWNANKMLWVDCECTSHVDCISNGSKKFLRSVDPCICVDWRELVDDNPQLFGIVDKEWGSHVIVNFAGPNGGYRGPYWLFGAPESNCSHHCSKCDINRDDIDLIWDATLDPFIDFNMLVVYRSVNGIKECGHVNKSGGITNYRIQTGNPSNMYYVEFGLSDMFGRFQRFPRIADSLLNLCEQQIQNGYAGWYIIASTYTVSGLPYDQPECPCDGWDPLPICQDHSIESKTDSILCNATVNICYPDPHGCDLSYATYRVHVDGHNVYVTNQTSCEDICVRWEPGRWEIHIFNCCVIRTSCGILVSGDSFDGTGVHAGNYVNSSVSIPSTSELSTTWGPYFSRHDGFTGVFTTADYPSGGSVISPPQYNEVRNNRGTLISYQTQGAPSGPVTKDAEPPLCHGNRCSSNTRVIYTSLEAFCATQQILPVTPCGCKREESGVECVNPSD